MTHDQKLNKILNGLLSRVPKRLSEKTDDSRLTFDFLCNVLLQNEDITEWEVEYIKNRLISDGYIKFIDVGGVQLPDITQEGIKFIQRGGYVKENEYINLDNKIKGETLKELKRGKIAFVLSIISIIIAFLSFLVSLLN